MRPVEHGLHTGGENIFHHTSPSGIHRTRLFLARGGYAAVQWVLRGEEALRLYAPRASFPPGLTGGFRCEVFHVRSTRFAPGGDGVFTNTLQEPLDGCFPDALEPFTPRALRAGRTHSLWLRFYARYDVAAGTHRIEVSLGGIQAAVTLDLTVLPVRLPSPRESALTVSYWSWNAGRLMEADEDDQICLQYGCKRYSPRWWRVMESFTRSWREHRINEVLVYPQVLLLDGGSELAADGRYHFDWRRFDEVVPYLYERSGAKSVSGSRLLFTPGTVTGEEGYEAYILARDAGGNIRRELRPIDSEPAERWWREYLPALQAHLEELGLLECYRQQIGDEPHTSRQVAQWKAVRERMRRYAPKLAVGDAFSRQAGLAELKEDVDVWVPRLDIYEENKAFYRERQQSGAQVWAYVCDLPAGNSLNRNVDQPAWMGRALLWLAAGYGLTGFLHWAWNMWQAPKDALRCRGQGYIVLPDRENLSVHSTIRYENLLAGIQDYELLTLLKKRRPGDHAALVKTVARRRDDYEKDPAVLQRAFDALYQCFEEGTDL